MKATKQKKKTTILPTKGFTQPTITQLLRAKSLTESTLVDDQIKLHTPKLLDEIQNVITVDDDEDDEKIGKITHKKSFKISQRPAKGRRSVQFKGFKVRPSDPINHLDSSWQTLHSAMQSIYLQRASELSLEELYKDRVSQLAESFASYGLFLSSKPYDKFSNAAEYQGIQILISLQKLWNTYCNEQLLVRNIFLYYDRTYLQKNKELPSIIELGHGLFRESFFGSTTAKEHILGSFVLAVNLERKGKEVPRDTLKELGRMFMSLGIYVGQFEKLLLAESQKFYDLEAASSIAPESEKQPLLLHAYLDLIDRRLSEESNRCSPSGYLTAGTKKGLVSAILQSFVATRVELVLKRHFEKSFRQKSFPELKRLFRLLKKVSKEDDMKTSFESAIHSYGQDITSGLKGNPASIQRLLSFIELVKVFVKESVDGQREFEVIAKDALCKVFAKSDSTIPQMMAAFMDQRMRQKTVTSEEIEASIDLFMDLFRFLAKRLLSGRHKQVSMEKLVVSKLKTECGPDFTGNLEGMLRDFELSSALRQEFEANNSLSPSISFNILTTGYWPSFPTASVELPELFEDLKKRVSTFYNSKHSGRNLQWIYSVSTCVIRANLKKADKELVTTTQQAAVLLQFNSSTALSFESIQKAVSVDEADLRRVLDHLCSDRVSLLQREPNGAEDVFSVNDDFDHALYRIKLNTGHSTDSTEEVAKTNKKVMVDRSHQIDAAIVRVMKSRKQLSHSDLLREISEILSFSFTTRVTA
ncbi:Cullin-4A [Phlyctochytrium planicorne]|nr:Cullin-4A [Phlyctochytrium planicorne]